MPSFLNLTNDFLTKNSYFLNKEDLNLQLLSHKDYPSFRSISDTFDYFGIENLAANVPVDALEQLPDHFLTLIKAADKAVFVSVHKTQNHVVCRSTEAKPVRYSYADFKKIWTGSIIVVEQNEKSESTRNRQMILISGLAILLMGVVMLYPFSLTTSLLGVLSVAGGILSWLITKEELGIQDQLSSKICNTINEKGSCAKIINSQARFLGLISLSTATAVFFTAQLAGLLFIGFDKGFFSVLLLAALPVILYSLYSQAVVLKEWCALCLAIIWVLLLEMAVVFTAPSSVAFHPAYYPKALLVIALAYIGVTQSKALLQKNITLQKTAVDFFKFKRHHGLFTSLLYKKQLPHHHSIPQQYEIGFGSDDPVITIKAVTNPLCGYCTDAFKAYVSLLEKYGRDIRISFIFSVPFEKPDNLSVKIALAVLEAYSQNKQQALQLLKEWFETKNVPYWEQKTVAMDAEKQLQLQSHRTWCDTNGIQYTPATFINNYYYPSEYKIQEFTLFADEMIQQLKENNVLIYQN